MSAPLISIIIPCYNQAQYLNEALQSIFDQTYSDWECIIVNDGSCDNTKQVAQNWLIKDNRFKYLYQKNKGVSVARNLGLDNSKGQYVQFLDSDDVLGKYKIESSVNCLVDSNSNIVITNFNTFSTDVKQSIEHPGFLNPDFFNFKGILYQWGNNFNIPIHCGIFSSNLFLDFRFSDQLKGNEDWMMWLFLFKKNPSVSFISKSMVFYRSHTESVTKNSAVMNDSYCKAIEHIKGIINMEEYIDFLLFLICKKEGAIIRLEEKIRVYRNSTMFKVLQKIKLNPLGNIAIKFFVKFIKKQ